VKVSMTAVSDVSPVFVTDPKALPGNVLPALARLLIDMRRRNLTNQHPPMMLRNVVSMVQAERFPSCSLAN
jgi:hypothetical protein